MAACSSIFAWRIPWTEGPGGLQKSHKRVRHDLVTKHQQPQTEVNVLLNLVSHSNKLIEPKERAMGRSHLQVNWREVVGNLRNACFQLTSEMGEQSCGTETLLCGTWHCFQVGSVRTEGHCRTPSQWCGQFLGGGKLLHTFGEQKGQK